MTSKPAEDAVLWGRVVNLRSDGGPAGAAACILTNEYTDPRTVIFADEVWALLAALARVDSRALCADCGRLVDTPTEYGCCPFCTEAIGTPDSEPSAEAPAWQPIATAPKDGKYVLIYGSQGVQKAHWAQSIGGPYAWLNFDAKGAGEATHWMPLPAAPVPATEGEMSDAERI